MKKENVKTKKNTKTKDGIFLVVCLILSAISFVALIQLMNMGAYWKNEKKLLQDSQIAQMQSDENMLYQHIVVPKMYNETMYTDYINSTFKYSNLAYTIYEDGENIFSNTSEECEYDSEAVLYTCSVRYGDYDDSNGYLLGAEQFTGADAKKELDAYIQDVTGKKTITLDSTREEYEDTADQGVVYVEELHLLKGLPEKDSYSKNVAIVKIVQGGRYVTPLFLVCMIVGAIFFYVRLIKTAGKKDETGELQLRWRDRVPLDLYTLFVLFVFYIEYALCYHVFMYRGIDVVIGSILGGSVSILVFVLYTMSISVRVKKKCLWKNLIIVKLVCFLWKLFVKGTKSIAKNMPFIWKGVLLIVGVSIIELIALIVIRYYEVNNYYYYDYYYSNTVDYRLVFFAIEKVIMIPLMLMGLINMNTLRKGGEELAKGNLKHTIDTKHMWPSLKEHAESLNQIQYGMSAAVDEKMKSEHFKTELITNVSHDIKTPLTSIINYVDLIEKEDVENETVKSYVSVLKRQSARLKKLIEDLIEASKASTGNLKVNLQKCEVDVLLTQTVGEFEEKLEKSDLDLQLKKEVENVNIMADGRHLWRIFDNLLNNIYKYAQPGTRVYLNLEKRNNRVYIIFRNTSKYPLNMTSEELMERFVRGDSSRNTEGTGLGLSIAQNLTELIGGTFKLDVDGDLFKVTLGFDELV